MNEINKIEIGIFGLDKNIELLIIPKLLKVYSIKGVKNISKDDIERIFNIICNWEKKYYIDTIDGENYSIKIYTENKIVEYVGNAVCAKNYNNFIEEVNKIYG